MDAAFLDLAAQCAPQVPAATIAAIVRVETDFNPLAIRLNSAGGPGLPRQPLNKAEAITRAKTLLAAGQDLDLGLAGVPADEFEKAGLPIEAAFEPCQSLRMAARLIDNAWKVAARLGKPDAAERQAIAAYYGRGDPSAGREAGYDERVLEAKADLAPRLPTLALRVSDRALPRRERFKGASDEPALASTPPSNPEPPREAVRAESAEEAAPSWDVFGASRKRGASMVVFNVQTGTKTK
ncbi:transglycosylase SLT domain-containing protein [Microvirga alba]|uniref:Transglycosylase SLT domain-containing protein n=1 Tax=Microvirga alba TaxID=2791025 RepID=A0A931BUY8_9HYPH|nr:transglycosylase SLT domain-containing protein [Microvirga alba]MBF9235605.1 transglycosylase SLT domain-containing protein [Microvirga alba]